MVVPTVTRSPRMHAGGLSLLVVVLGVSILAYNIVCVLDYTSASLLVLGTGGAVSKEAEAEPVVIANSIFGPIFKLTQRADQWSLWHATQRAALSRDDVSCEWAAFKPFGRREKTTGICTYPVNADQFVSGQIKGIGRWSDCDELVGLWNEATAARRVRASSSSLASSASGEHKKTMIYVDVGGNIGSCVMEMLQSTDANIVVFEPHPHNLAQLTTTISRQPDEHVRNRVVIFPVGVGDVVGNFTMHMSSNNRGHSVVGETAFAERPGQQFLEAEKIYVERLNDIFDMDKVVIPLMKMDIQGFECKALDGMTSLLPAVDILHTELDAVFLKNQGCSPQAMTMRIASAGFSLKVNGANLVARRNIAQSP
jgi:FkbM family methyltransferase